MLEPVIALGAVVLFFAVAFWLGRRVGARLHGGVRQFTLYALVVVGLFAVFTVGRVTNEAVLIVVGLAWMASFLGVLTAE